MPLLYYIDCGVLYLWVLLFGCCIGSFLNVVIYRVPLGISVADGRSFCPGCHHKIRWYDNIPVVSWLCLKGRCRDCGMPISGRYPFVESMTGCAAVLSVNRFGFTGYAFCVFVTIAILICIAWIDADTMMIPNRFVAALLVCAAASAFFQKDITLTERFVGFVAVSVPMLILTIAVSGAFGGGDIKLMAAAGLMLGLGLVILSAFIGIVTGGVYAFWLLISKKVRRGEGAHMAFGPFLAFGIFVSMMWGRDILTWYMGLMQ